MDFVAEGAGVGSVIKAKDGSLWVSVTQNIDGDGVMCNSIVRVDAESLKTTEYVLPDGIYPHRRRGHLGALIHFVPHRLMTFFFGQAGRQAGLRTKWFSNMI